MTKYKLPLLLSLCLSGQVLADGFVAAGIGAGGTALVKSVTGEVGGFTRKESTNYMMALGVTALNNSHGFPDHYVNSPAPGGSQYDFFKRQKEVEIGFVAKFGVEIIPNQQLILFGLAGAGVANDVLFAKDVNTGTLYKQADGYHAHGYLGAGLAYYPRWFPLGVSIEYDKRRGMTGLLSILF